MSFFPIFLIPIAVYIVVSMYIWVTDFSQVASISRAWEKILFQTITDLERKHLQSTKRDAYREREVTEDEDISTPKMDWNLFADTVTGPLTQLARQDRYELLRKTMESLPEHDREILELRHFDGMSNTECAEALHLTQKAASIRYVRALEHLKKQLIEFTEFRP